VPSGEQFLVNTHTTNLQGYPAVAADADGDFIVVWSSLGQDGSRFGVYGQRYDASGVAQGGEFRINQFTTELQFRPAVSMDAGGDFCVAWTSFTQDGSGYGIYARRFSASGVAQGDEFRVNALTSGHQNYPSLAMDPGGDFVVAWHSQHQDGSAYGIYAQRYAAVPGVSASDFLFETAPQRLRCTFDRNVGASLSSSDLMLRNLTTNQTVPSSEFSVEYDATTNRATFNFTGGAAGASLPDGNYRATLPAGGIQTPQGAALASDVEFDFFVLAGDANRDRKVDVADLGVLASNWQQSPRTFSQGNFDYSPDGLVDVADLGILASQWQQQLVAPTAPARQASVDLAHRARRLIHQVMPG
jgi:hypothetical protein